jgi:putative ABC transport system permease protein
VFPIKAALRRLIRQPAFAAAAIGTLALGLAATTALFAVVDATLLRPLPYRNASDIYTVRTTMTDGRFTIGLLASEEMADLRRATDLVSASALTQRLDVALVTDDGARSISAVAVSQGFFDVFGLPMALGRSFRADDFAARAPVVPVVLSYRLWVTTFGRDSGIVGRTIQLASRPALVVGVAPDAFDIPHDADLWWALETPPETIGHGYDAYIRLRAGATPEAVQAQLGPMWRHLADKYPDFETNRIFVMRSLLDSIVGDLGPTALIAFAATGLLLVLAIVNVGNLLLARSAGRARDIAVHAALGASRWQIVGLLVAESALIALGAAALAMPLAWAAVRGIVVIGGGAFPRVGGLHVSPSVLFFASGVTTAAGVLVGLVPALAIARTNLAALTNESGRSAMQGRRSRRLLGTMIVAEVALAVALVAGAGRLILSVRNLLALDPGFTTTGRLTVNVMLPAQPYYQPDRAAAWMQDVETRLRAMGATQIGAVSSLPLEHDWDSTAFVDIVGRPTDPAHRPNGRIRTVTPDLFAALDISILAGRNFTAADRLGAQPVAIVSQSWARKFLPGLDPLREHIVLPGLFAHRVGDQVVSDPIAIVGVAGDVHYKSLTGDPEPVVYLSSGQHIMLQRSLVVTTADGHPERLIPQIRAALRAVEPRAPVEFDTLSHAVASALIWPKLGVLLMGTFGTVALVLATAGVFGVIAYVVAQRAGEMAVRLALGATRRQVFRLVLRQGGGLAVQGVVVGGLLAWWMGGLMSRYVYGVSAANIVVLGGSAVVVLLAAVAAALPSARRAARVEPASTLRA